MFDFKVAVTAARLLVPVAEFESIDEPIWCAETANLVAQIATLGGQAVKQVYAGDGRTYVWYWNDWEEVVVEHNSSGSSCLVRLVSPP